MAGTPYKKHHGASAAKANFRHVCKDKRAYDKHSNKHIDTSKTYLNTSISEIETGHDLTFDEVCDKYDRIIDEAAEVKNIRKNAVTLFTWTVTIPPEITDRAQQLEWFQKVANIDREMFGEENFIDGKIDYDEIHEYIDPQTKQTRISLAHMETMLVPRMVNKDGTYGRLNCNEIYKQETFRKHIAAIREMTLKDYGIKYTLNDTADMTKEERYDLNTHKTVEQCKVESEIAEAELLAEEKEKTAKTLEAVASLLELQTQQEKQIEENDSYLKEQGDCIDKNNKAITKLNNELADKTEQRNNLLDDIETLEIRYTNKTSEEEELNKSISDKQEELNKVEAQTKLSFEILAVIDDIVEELPDAVKIPIKKAWQYMKQTALNKLDGSEIKLDVRQKDYFDTATRERVAPISSQTASELDNIIFPSY